MNRIRTLPIAALLVVSAWPGTARTQTYLIDGQELDEHHYTMHRGLPDGSVFGAGFGFQGPGVVGWITNTEIRDDAGSLGVFWYWSTTYGETGNDYVLDARASSDGQILFCGALNNQQPWLVKVDSTDGSILWQKELLMSGHFLALAVLPDGCVAAGLVNNGDVLVSRFDTNGGLVWARSYGWTDSTEYATGIALHPSGDLIVAGTTTQLDAVNLNVLAFRIDLAGNLKWARNLGDSGQREGRQVGMCTTPSGDVVLVAGPNDRSPFEDEVLIVRLDGQGDTLWTESLALGTTVSPTDVAATADDGCVLVGSFSPVGASNPWVAKLAADGSLAWTRHLNPDPALSSGADSVELTPNDGLLVGGTDVLGNYHTIRLEEDGFAAVPCPSIVTMFAATTPRTISESDVLPPAQTIQPLVLNSQAVATSRGPDLALDCLGCQVNVRVLGQGTTGSGNFAPSLTGQEGTCELNGGRTLDIAGGLGGTRGLMFIGVDTLSFPLYGGTFHVNLAAPWFPLNLKLGGAPGAPGAGTWNHVSTSNLQPYLGMNLYFQALLFDPAAPQGVTMTNALHWLIGN